LLYPPVQSYFAQGHELPDFADEISRLCVSIYQQQKGVHCDPDLLNSTARTLLEGVYSGYGNDFVSVDWNTPDHLMLTRLTRNVFSFSAAKNYQELRTITSALRDDEGRLRSFPDFRDQVSAINAKFNQVWLQTEYDTCIATATQSARWQQFQEQKNLFPYLRYQTAGDESVRDEHRALDGVTKRIDDPFWRTYYPPNGWNCRCEAIQVPEDDVQETPEGSYKAPFIPQLFRTNSGQTGLIFPQGHPYYTDVPNSEIRRAIAYLPPENGYLDGHINLSGRQVPVRHHVMHNLDELPGNNEVLSDLLRLKPEITEVSLLPDIHYKDADLKPKFYPENWKFHNKDKNADAVLSFGKQEEWVVDFKRLQGNGKHLAPHLEKAAQQADYAIIKLPENRSESIKSICNTADKKLDSTKLKGILIIDNDGQLVYERYKTKSAVKR
jgi:phage protein F-like protein